MKHLLAADLRLTQIIELRITLSNKTTTTSVCQRMPEHSIIASQQDEQFSKLALLRLSFY